MVLDTGVNLQCDYIFSKRAESNVETLKLGCKNLVILSYAISLIRRVVVRRAPEVAKSGGSSLNAGNRIPVHRALGVQHPQEPTCCLIKWEGERLGEGGKYGLRVA
jgi:hypothetical protein